MIRIFAISFAAFAMAVSVPATATPMDDVIALLDADKDAEAFALAQKLSEAGEPDGDEALAWFYERGIVVQKDLAMARTYYLRAAKAGRKHSQWKAGVMLDTGVGGVEDPDQAFKWIKKSADQDYGLALVSMGVMHATGRGTPVDYTKSMKFYTMAARAGQAHGFYGIGVLYNLGQGVEKDLIEAAAHMVVAGTSGDEAGQKGLRNIAPALSDEDMRAVATRATEISKEYGLKRKIMSEDEIS